MLVSYASPPSLTFLCTTLILFIVASYSIAFWLNQINSTAQYLRRKTPCSKVCSEKFVGTLRSKATYKCFFVSLLQYFQWFMHGRYMLYCIVLDSIVLCRKKPPGKLLPGAHAIEREFQVRDFLIQVSAEVKQLIMVWCSLFLSWKGLPHKPLKKL